MAEHVVFVAEDDGQPNKRLRQKLAENGNEHIIVSPGKPVLARVEFQLSTHRVGRDEKDEEHDDSRHHERTKIDIITAPRVGNLMHIQFDRLQECLYLPGSISLGAHRGLSHSRRA